MSDFGIRGYAIPFEQAERFGHHLTLVDPSAFDEMLARPTNVYLNYGDHAATPICRVTLHKDDYGLAFAASVSSRDWWGMHNAVATTCQFASVGFVGKITAGPDRLPDGTRCRRIRAKSIT